jgi:chemotaxis protein histidine kinase CheA
MKKHGKPGKAINIKPPQKKPVKETTKQLLVAEPVKDTTKPVVITESVKETTKPLLVADPVKETTKPVVITDSFKETVKPVVVTETYKDVPKHLVTINKKSFMDKTKSFLTGKHVFLNGKITLLNWHIILIFVLITLTVTLIGLWFSGVFTPPKSDCTLSDEAQVELNSATSFLGLKEIELTNAENALTAAKKLVDANPVDSSSVKNAQDALALADNAYNDAKSERETAEIQLNTHDSDALKEKNIYDENVRVAAGNVEDAVGKAEEAVTTADTAKQTADAAKQTAEEAVEKAAKAKQNAEDALAKKTNAENIANNTDAVQLEITFNSEKTNYDGSVLKYNVKYETNYNDDNLTNLNNLVSTNLENYNHLRKEADELNKKVPYVCDGPSAGEVFGWLFSVIFLIIIVLLCIDIFFDKGNLPNLLRIVKKSIGWDRIKNINK